MVTKKTIKIPIYNYTVYVNIFDDWNEVTKSYASAGGNVDDEREGFILTSRLNPTKIKLFVNAKCESCISHELIHIKNEIFNGIGYKVDTDNDEPEAYLMKFLWKNISKVFRKHNAKS